MSARADVLLWAQRVLGMKKASPHLLLEISEHGTMEQATAAFHKIARLAHPDLNRGLEPNELELVTRAYSRVAAAYQDFRSGARERPDGRAATPSPMSGQMSSKALVQYRKAELALKRGELQVGLLHLKMAIAADPQSAFLREALARVEDELKNA